MRAAVVVEADPITDDAGRMLDALEAMAMNALLPECADDALDHAVLLGAAWGDELLLQPVAAHQGREVTAGEDQAVVRPQQELLIYLSQGAEPSDQSVLQGRAGGGGLARAGQVPAQKLTGVTVDHQRERCPAILAGPDAGQIRRPALVWRDGHGRDGLDTRPHAHGALTNLPALELENPLDRVFIKAQQPSNSAIAEGGLLLDHGFDRVREAGIDLRQ